MSIQVQVLNAAVSVRSFPARDGKPAVSFNEQKVAIIRPNDFPLPFTITLDDGQQPYQEGVYDLCPSSLESGKYGGLQFGRRIKLLTPAPKPGISASK